MQRSQTRKLLNMPEVPLRWADRVITPEIKKRWDACPTAALLFVPLFHHSFADHFWASEAFYTFTGHTPAGLRDMYMAGESPFGRDSCRVMYDQFVQLYLNGLNTCQQHVVTQHAATGQPVALSLSRQIMYGPGRSVMAIITKVEPVHVLPHDSKEKLPALESPLPGPGSLQHSPFGGQHHLQHQAQHHLQAESFLCGPQVEMKAAEQQGNAMRYHSRQPNTARRPKHEPDNGVCDMDVHGHPEDSTFDHMELTTTPSFSSYTEASTSLGDDGQEEGMMDFLEEIRLGGLGLSFPGELE